MAELLNNIFTISLESAKRHKAYSIYDGSRLAITHCIPIVGASSAWKDELIEEIQDKSNKGFTVMIEDRSQVFCVSDAIPFSFEDVEDGRSMLFQALDWYFAMLDMGQIIADKEVERYLIRTGGEGQKIEKTQDEKGRTIYKVDWSSVSGGTKAVLMCVVGAVMPPLTNRYLEQFYGPLSDESDSTHDYNSTFRAITQGVDRSRMESWNDFYDN